VSHPEKERKNLAILEDRNWLQVTFYRAIVRDIRIIASSLEQKIEAQNRM
jgi:hypothetical protein